MSELSFGNYAFPLNMRSWPLRDALGATCEQRTTPAISSAKRSEPKGWILTIQSW
jgi:hypothetical protein